MKMTMSKRKNVWVGLLIIVLLVEVWFSESEGCLKLERDALLQLKAHLHGPIWSIDWLLDGSDCCRWDNVECDNTTRRVVQLTLKGLPYPGMGRNNLNMSDFHAFEDLRSLVLISNNIAACVQNEGSDGKATRLSNLRELDLTDNLLNDTSNIQSCLSGLSSLKTLKLAANDLSVKSFRIEGKERLYLPASLEFLDLRHNKLSNDIVSSLSKVQNLKWLDLSYNQLEGSVDISGLCNLSKLEKLDLSGNSNISSFVVGQGTNISLSSMKEFYLDDLKIEGSMLHKSLRAFSSIRILSLDNEEFKGTFVAEDFGYLENLEELKLGGSYIGNESFKNIGGLVSLKFLSVRKCKIKDTLLPTDWSNLQKLKVLKIQSNEFEGPLPITGWSNLKKVKELYLNSNKFKGFLPLSFVNMTFLQKLDLSDNSFNGNIASNLATLPLLEYLDFSRNQFEVPASFTFLANHTNLKFIYGGGNKLIPDIYPTFRTWVPKFQLQEFNLSSKTEASSLPLPNFLLHQYNLSLVDLTGSRFEAEFPNWLLENNTKMSILRLRNCSFGGHFRLPSHSIPDIQILDVSDNSIGGQISGNNISSIFPYLSTMDMSRNAITGSLPREFGELIFLNVLDLSYNHLSGEIPKNISEGHSPFRILNLSNNKLDGLVCSTFTLNDQLWQLHLDGNRFSGSVEGCFKNMSELGSLDLSNNHFVGEIPNLVSSPLLERLSLANNHLEGSIPRELFELSDFMYLDLSKNNLSGSIPSFANSSSSYINLSNNKLSGLATTMFNENSSSSILDLSNNEITSTLQHLMGNVSELKILLLRGNHIFGQIPNELCQLKNLSMVDLSYNGLSGLLPICLSKISFGANKQADELSFFHLHDQYDYIVEKQVEFSTKNRLYTYKGNILLYMSGMDLSHNELNGTIPPEFGNLIHIRAMNLSNNHLTGEIPITLSNLKQIESLDLSFNKLSGKIPLELTELTTLEVFSLAYNNLSGTTPERKGQFITFDDSCYEGNPLLCGPPLNRSCTDYSGSPNDADGDENSAFMDMQFFYISFLVSYASILLVLAIVLRINSHWRRAWFYFIEFVINSCYYFVVGNLRRWFTY